MQNTIVKNWFESDFARLDPALQRLHLSGGELSGDIDLEYGKGVSGIVGKRLAKKLHLPAAGEHRLVVSIFHSEKGLHWNRTFNNSNIVESLFTPVGTISNGHWIETTGPLSIKLTVDIKDRGWHWRCIHISLFGIPIPLWLTPRSNAFKTIENGKYRFKVEFTLPVLGLLVSYQGLLDAKYND